MLQDIEEKEELALDCRRLKNNNYGWRNEIENVADINTYDEIKTRIDEFIKANEQLTCKEVDEFVSFLAHCKKHYIEK